MPKKGGKKAAAKAAPAPKKGKAAAPKATGAPQIVSAKGGLNASQLLDLTLRTMEEENWISKKAGRDFIESLKAVIEDELGQGNPVKLFGMLKLTPRYHTAGKREVYKEFGNPDSGKTTKSYKPKVSLKATTLKPLKEALPAPQKMAKAVGK